MTYSPYDASVPVPDGPSRRQLLGTAAAALVAGCLDGESDPGGDSSPEDDPATNDSDVETDPDDTGDATDDPAVPERFDDVERLRTLAPEYLEVLADGDYETASEWADPEYSQALSATRLRQVWQGTVGDDAPLDAVHTVAYLGTELGNDTFLLRATFGGQEFEFTLSFSDDGVVLLQALPIDGWSPPEYVDESAFTEQDLTLETPLDCALGATLSLPEGEQPVPGVVLVHGNGPQDRDGTVGPNRMFTELAWGLASRGVAVLRYDKRSYACDPDLADVTIDDLVTDDALTAIDRLRAHDRVAPDRIAVLGHSFGGLLAPRIAVRDGDLAGVAMLAPGPARSFAETIVDQVEHTLDLQGVTGTRREETMARVEAETEKIESLDIGEDEVVRFGGLEYHESLQAYDHTGTAASLDVPRLLLQGERDWQITVEDDLPIWREAIADEESVEIRTYEELNHLFQVSVGPMSPAEYTQPGNPVDERVIDDLATFLTERLEPAEPAPRVAQSRIL